jgi:hypothetical protein
LKKKTGGFIDDRRWVGIRILFGNLYEKEQIYADERPLIRLFLVE